MIQALGPDLCNFIGHVTGHQPITLAMENTSVYWAGGNSVAAVSKEPWEMPPSGVS